MGAYADLRRRSRLVLPAVVLVYTAGMQWQFYLLLKTQSYQTWQLPSPANGGELTTISGETVWLAAIVSLLVGLYVTKRTHGWARAND
jgi:hypothetical protein